MISEHDILLYLEGRANKKLSSTVETWAAQSQDNAEELQDYREVMALADQCKGYKQYNVEEAWSKIDDLMIEIDEAATLQPTENGSKSEDKEAAVKIKRISSRTVWSIAASFAILIAAAAYLYLNRTQMVEVVTAVGEEEVIILPDGSTASVKESSTLKYLSSFNKQSERKINLFGEATFDVVSDANKAFVVETTTTGTEVLGTIFNIESRSKEAKLKNLEGLIEFFALDNPDNKITLEEGDSILFDGSGFIDLKPPPPPPPAPPGNIINVEDLINVLLDRYAETFVPGAYMPESDLRDSVRADLGLENLDDIMEIIDSFNTAEILSNKGVYTLQRLRSGPKTK